jgi:hypothetical protein
MKKIIILIAMLALCIAAKLEEVARYNDIISRNRDNAERAEIERLQQDERIKEIEKELRLIHTDIDIIQNGSKK